MHISLILMQYTQIAMRGIQYFTDLVAFFPNGCQSSNNTNNKNAEIERHQKQTYYLMYYN